MLSIRAALPADQAGMCALLPRLAAFDLPDRRNPEDLWRGDETALLAWLAGDDPDAFAHVAVDKNEVVGVVFVRLGNELLSGEPSAHIESLAVALGNEGRGIATKLIAVAEETARERGALTMTLNVFASNTRARGLYQRLGYDGELIRCIKGI